MLEIFRNYLKKEEYYIILYSNYIYIYNYKDIIKFTDTYISLEFNNLKLNIKGRDLISTKMEKDELLIKGNIINLEKVYE